MLASSRVSTESRVNVLHLGKFDTQGGIERHVKALASRLVSARIGVVNLVSNDTARTDRHDKYGYSTVRAACWGTASSLAVSPTLPLIARQLHRTHRFDLVHLHFPDPLGHLTALALPRSVRRVITWHSDIVRQRLALGAYAPFMRSFAQTAAAIIGATPQHFSTSTQIPPPSELQIQTVIPYGIDPSTFVWTAAARTRRADLQARHRGRLVFAVGRHVYYKGFDVLIRSMRNVDAELIIGGRGPLTDSLKSATRDAGVESKVHFAGYIEDDELIAYYDACDVFCMPSTERSEQFGLVQLEAMQMAKPIVTTRLGTGVEYVTLDGETGVLVPPHDETALASALNALLVDPARRSKLGAAGRRRVADVFSADRMAQATLDLYEQILDRTAPP